MTYGSRNLHSHSFSLSLTLYVCVHVAVSCSLFLLPTYPLRFSLTSCAGSSDPEDSKLRLLFSCVRRATNSSCPIGYFAFNHTSYTHTHTHTHPISIIFSPCTSVCGSVRAFESLTACCAGCVGEGRTMVQQPLPTPPPPTPPDGVRCMREFAPPTTPDTRVQSFNC